MVVPRTLSAFTAEEKWRVQQLLAAKVAVMMRRKLEEGDWSQVYCAVKGIPYKGWSNLGIDITHQNLGLELKMLCKPSKETLKEYCGTSLMHPALTRSIRIPDEKDPTLAAKDVLQQYANTVALRTEAVRKNAPEMTPDMRTGWLLWQESLREFLYFEEEMLAPNPDDYYAEWKESGTEAGTRKPSKNLWVYETDTQRKRYSITTGAGPKIQPYFDVPPPNDPNLPVFVVQGEILANGLVRIWITASTARYLREKVGSLDPEPLSERIIQVSAHLPKKEIRAELIEDQVEQILVNQRAYAALQNAFLGVSDEHMMQMFAKYLQTI